MANYKDIISGTISAISDKVKEVADNHDLRGIYENGASRAKSYANIAKLTLEVNGEKEELKRIYQEIGELFYEQNETAPDGFFGSLFCKVQETRARIDDMEREIANCKAECAPASAEKDIDVEICNFDDVVDATEEEGK